MGFFNTGRRDEIRAKAARGRPLYDRPKPPPLPKPAEEEYMTVTEEDIVSEPLDIRRRPAMQAALDGSLLKAVREGDVAAAKHALSSGANVDAGIPPAYTHVMGGDYSKRKWGDTALMMAARAGDLAMVDLLLRYGADVHRDYGYGSYPFPTALTYARRGGHEEVAKLLVQHGARDGQ